MTPAQNIASLFFQSAEKFPQKPALVDRDDSAVTFADFAEEVKATEAYYRSRNIHAGDRVLVFVPMGIPLYRSILALFSIGAVAVFLDEWVSKERLETCCRLAKCKAFIAPFKLRALALLSAEMRKIPVWLGTSFKKSSRQSAVGSQQFLPDSTALITFTTGSTGIPKAADRTHAFLNAQFEALVDKIQPKESDIDMPVLPIVLLLNLGTGVTSVIADWNSRKPETLDVKRIHQQLSQWKCNRLTASPYFVERISEVGAQFSTLRSVFTGGAPVFPSQAKKMIAGLKGTSVQIVYGSTEAEPISSIFADELVQRESDLEKGLPVGKPYHGTRVIILPVTENAIEVKSEEELFSLKSASGNVGEIVVSGKHVLRHYIDNPEAEKLNKIFIGENVWHRTGDAGFLDEKGDLHLCGRCSTLIYDDKKKLLAPFLWEGWFRSLEGISAGTILKKEDKIVAVLEPESNCNKVEVSGKVKARYPFSEIVFPDKIPRDPRHFSKIDYGKLKEVLK